MPNIPSALGRRRRHYFDGGRNPASMNPTDYSLADFYFSDSLDPLDPPAEFGAWRKSGEWEASLYGPAMLGAAVPRLRIHRGGRVSSVINLTSYNYMGFATHPEVIAAAQDALAHYGTGACGSPILSGMADLHRELEARLAAFMDRESVMLYSSGFGGAMGAISGLLRKGDAAILDAKCHLSLIDGAKLSGARLHFFDHNCPESLDQVLQKTRDKRRLVLVEGIYSMDGDMADLPALTEVTEAHGCSIFIDEAHSILAWGANGRGTAEHFGLEHRIGMTFSTFSKSFAAVGGCVAGKRPILDYLRYYSNPYGFSCALPPAVAAGLLKVLELTTAETSNGGALHPRVQLQEKARYFREQLVDMGINIGESTTQVVPIILGSNRRLLYELGHELQERGLFLAPVDYPSVREDGLRFRAAVTAAHTRKDLDEALQIIKDTVVPRIGG